MSRANPALLSRLHAWYLANEAPMSSSGVSLTYGNSPDDGRLTHGAWINARRATEDVELLIWDTGDGELGAGWNRGNGDFGSTVEEHLDLRNLSDLDRALERVRNLIERMPVA